MVRLLTRLYLERTGVADQVELVETGYDTVQQLLSGKIDAAGGVFGDAVSARHQGATVDSLSVADVIPSYGHVVAASPSVVEERPATVRAFLRGTAHGAAWATRHPGRAIDLLVEQRDALATARAVQREKWETMANDYVLSAAVREHGWGWGRAEPWETVRDALADADLLGGAVEPGSVWTNDLLDTDSAYVGSYADAIAEG
jgi:NitT/TauT family transport system substrate-binding protein